VPDATAELRWRFERAHRLLKGPSHVRGVLDHAAVSAAHEAALQLHESRSTTVLCHGDFLDKNILLDERDRWCAIDPRPCLGDPALDAAFWALAHRGGQGATERWRIVAGAAELSPERVWAWVRVFAISEAVLARDATRANAYHAVLRHGDPDCST
jgi:streptomycin 6-kinase